MTTAKLTFSVIVNTTDRADSLRTLLRALAHQSYPHFEVIVVLGPTKDNSLAVLDHYRDRVQVLRCAKANLSQSRNIGLAAARGDIVVYIDDDAVPSYHWLAQLAHIFQDPYIDGSGGSVYLIHPNFPTLQHRIGIISSLAEQIDVRDSWLDNIVPNGQGRQWTGRMMGTNMAYRRQAILEVGGFDEFFEWVYDDTDTAVRLAAAGKIIHPVKEAVVYHVPASSRNRVAYTQFGRWWVQTKAALYFAIKNGPPGGDSRAQIMLRCLHFVHGHWLWSRQVLKQDKITYAQFLRWWRGEIQSILIATYTGLLRPRTLLDENVINRSDTEIRPFNNGASTYMPTVDPISGRQPQISLTAPPLRICLMSSAYPPDQFEGVGRHTNLMAQGLFECGHTVHVVTHGQQEAVTFYEGAYVHKVPYQLERYTHYRHLPRLHHTLNRSHAFHHKIKRLILNDGIQVVDTPLWQMDGLITAVSGQIPVVLRLQTATRLISAIQQDHDMDARLVGELEQSLINQATHLVPNSQATVKTIESVYGVQLTPNRFDVIPHGIVPVPDTAIRPLDTTNLPHTFTILYVGRLEKRKGIQELFQAIPTILKQIPNAQFVIAGSDNSQHDGFKAKTGQDYPTYFAQKYAPYANKVIFKGFVDEEELQILYQNCDLFVAPSLYESFGLIYLEAMNYAKPVIGCQAGGIPEVIEQGITGSLVEPEAAPALAEAIITLLQNPARLREMGLAGRQRLLDNFTHVQMAREFARVYRAVTNGR